jgi:hypothetical protein
MICNLVRLVSEVFMHLAFRFSSNTLGSGVERFVLPAWALFWWKRVDGRLTAGVGLRWVFHG